MPLVRKPARPAADEGREPGDALKSLADPDSDRRWRAARDAVNLDGGDAALAAALPAEKDARVREAMFTGLARLGTPTAVEAVTAQLRSDDANVRSGALEALRIMIPQVHDLLPRLLADPDTDIRILSCELARSMESAEATQLLCTVLDKDADENVCAAAVEVLAEVGGPEALPSLENCALKFGSSPFLSFAIKAVIERLAAQNTTRA
ncbi:MAG TPA: HEAT repeat domain-containing protein [Steroidobacteraceae bacterium]|nr:HEAT repeat domain-containing protein [Steroidobacteraceae bacterium]